MIWFWRVLNLKIPSIAMAFPKVIRSLLRYSSIIRMKSYATLSTIWLYAFKMYPPKRVPLRSTCGSWTGIRVVINVPLEISALLKWRSTLIVSDSTIAYKKNSSCNTWKASLVLWLRVLIDNNCARTWQDFKCCNSDPKEWPIRNRHFWKASQKNVIAVF